MKYLKMSSDDDWDVEQHKTEHECNEHWELRRKFLLTHKDRFPEDELVCLAQVFVNVELLGCRYPQETMELIAELAQDVVSDYRERQKKRLQRTFVKASDAASSKINKKLTAPRSTTSGDREADSDIAEVPVKKRKVDPSQPFGDIVVVERPGDIPQNTLSAAVCLGGGHLEWKCDKEKDSWKCTILVDSQKLVEATDQNQKQAKKEASIAGLEELKKHYYTIKIKHNVNGNANVTTTTILEGRTCQESISDDNIGKKLMKLMGWTGGGLGKSQQGILEPVTIKQQISREGIGLKSKSSTTNDLKMKSKDIMRKYLAGDMKEDLIFSAEFTNDERAVIHQVARQMGLKSHSYGSKNQRTLVVTRKIDVRDLVEELKSLGGSTEKYELIAPGSK